MCYQTPPYFGHLPLLTVTPTSRTSSARLFVSLQPIIQASLEILLSEKLRENVLAYGF